MNYSEKIYELRKNEGISQEALAAAIGTTRQQISRWECGNAVPNPKFAYALAAHFGCTIEELFGEKIENDTEDVSTLPSFNFANIAIVISILSIINMYLVTLVGYFSSDIGKYFYECFGAMRDAGVEYNAGTVNIAIRGISERICEIAIAWTAMASALLVILMITLLIRYMKKTKNKIIRSNIFTPFVVGLTFVLSSFIAGVFILSVGQHVGFFPESTLDLLDGTLYLLIALYGADLIVTLLRMVLRSSLKNVLVLTPWKGGKKAFEIVYVSIGIPLFLLYIIGSSQAYAAVLIYGLIYFPFALMMLIVHFINCYSPFGKKEA